MIRAKSGPRPPHASAMEAPMSVLRAGKRPKDETIRITIKVTPESAKVTLDGKVSPARPIVLPRSAQTHRLRVSAKGYQPEEIPVPANSNQTLVINLKRKEPTRIGGRLRPRTPRPRGMRRRPTGMKDIRALTDI